jgi:hypothetical protein
LQAIGAVRMTGLELRHVKVEGDVYFHRDDLVRMILGVSEKMAVDEKTPGYIRGHVAEAFDQLGMSIAMMQVENG